MTDSVITARGLTKRFGEVTAVDGIDFEIAPGESFGFLGPNGAGKSTTMRMIAATSTRTDGELSVLGLDTNRNGPEIRAQLGIVPQGDLLDEEAASSTTSMSTDATSACLAPMSRNARSSCWTSRSSGRSAWPASASCPEA